jgi:hypothetical protein
MTVKKPKRKPRTNRNGRPSTHRLLLTVDQLEWARRAVSRLVDTADRRDQSARLKSILSGLEAKLTEQGLEEVNGSFVISTNRNELHILKEVAQAEHLSLTSTIIPGYQERFQKAIEGDGERPRLQAYIDKATKRASLMSSIVNICKRLL